MRRLCRASLVVTLFILTLSLSHARAWGAVSFNFSVSGGTGGWTSPTVSGSTRNIDVRISSRYYGQDTNRLYVTLQRWNGLRWVSAGSAYFPANGTATIRWSNLSRTKTRYRVKITLERYTGYWAEGTCRLAGSN